VRQRRFLIDSTLFEKNAWAADRTCQSTSADGWPIDHGNIRGQMSALLRAFVEDAGSIAARLGDCDAIATAELLAALYARGRAAHPRVVVSEEAFGRHLARCANAGSPGNTASLAELEAEDLYLACACAVRARGAAAAFEQRFGRVIRRAVSRVLDTADERQEAEQRAWQYLLFEGGDGPARISHYLGRGPLEKWVSVAAMRIAISFGRTESAERRLREKAIAEASGVDPEALFAKGDLREAFESAVTEALGALKPRERLVMKLFLVSGMTLDQIGKSLGITRQAVSKTLARARETIVERVQASVQKTLKLTKEDLTSVLRYVASQLDVSISRVLGES
jgi:RNA polymerase sigma-70 factor (ECF subfamily)